MKIKVSKHKLTSTIEVLREEVELRNTRTVYVMHIPNALSLTSAKIPIAFFFSQRHFNNVTSNAPFYGGHLVMRSNRCAVQNQGIKSLLHLGQIVITFRTLLHLGSFIITFRPSTTLTCYT